MSLPSLWQSSYNYKITTDVYEGPLDLLLQLIEQSELDITKLSLAKVTDQYLKHLESLAHQDPIEVSAFLVIAAKLVFIKSSILLPVPKLDIDEYEEDLGDELARQLLEYKKYKQIGQWLFERQENGQRSYLRISQSPIIRETLNFSEINIYDFVDIILNTLFQNENTTPMSDVVTISPLTIKQKIDEIKKLFQGAANTSFKNILGNETSKLNIVVTFLALLELIKHFTITASQQDLFDNIHLQRSGDLDADFEMEL